MIFNTTGGGTALNFRVVGGSTAPKSASENCIWVNTETPITSWIFSATEPSPAEGGMVWITIGTSSEVEFNALKKNGIQVYPISASQYVGGEWVEVTAKSYQGGAWVDWFSGTWLYNGGSKNEDLTGGWKIASTATAIAAHLTDTGIVFSIGTGVGRDGAVYTKNKINVTDFDWLIAESVTVADHNGSGPNGFTIGLNSQNTSNTSSGWTAAYQEITRKIANETISIDLRSVSGEYYIGIQADVATGVVDKLYLI